VSDCILPILVNTCCLHNIALLRVLQFWRQTKGRQKPKLVHYSQVSCLKLLLQKKNQCIRKKTEAQNIAKEIKQYPKKWLQHVQRMDTNRIPKQALQYRPPGQWNIG
jgi:hypothetical protein